VNCTAAPAPLVRTAQADRNNSVITRHNAERPSRFPRAQGFLFRSALGVRMAITARNHLHCSPKQGASQRLKALDRRANVSGSSKYIFIIYLQLWHQ
jgi:hypothetical protein